MLSVAFKEWAVVVDALGSGRQVFILRKGGIHEGKSGFKMEHAEFLLFPTLFHQQRESVIPEAQRRYDEIAPLLPGPETLRIEYWARVMEWHPLRDFAAVQRLSGQHIWREELLRERFEWGREQLIYAIAVRVFRLPARVELPMRSEYGGCKSWIELDRDVDASSATPVLDDPAFEAKLKRFTVLTDAKNL